MASYYSRYLRNTGRLIFTILLSFFIFQGCGNDSSPADTGKISINPTKLDFGSVQVNSTRTLNLSIKNEKSSSIEINLSISGDDKDAFEAAGSSKRTVQKDTTTNIVISFTPTEEKEYSASLKVGTISDIALSGTGTTEEVNIYINKNPLDFGEVNVSSSKTEDLLFQNNGNSTVTLDPVIDGADASSFKITNMSDNKLESGEIDEITIEFSPESAGDKTAQIWLDAEKTAMAKLTGTGTTEEVNIYINKNPLDFGEVNVSSSKTEDLLFQNNGNSTVTLDPVIDGADASSFKITNMSDNKLESGEIDEITIEFSPESAGDKTAQIWLDAEKTAMAKLTGKGIKQQDIDITPKTLDFGTVKVGETNEKECEITNKSGSQLTVDITVPDGFKDVYSITKDVSGTILPGAKETFKIAFTPVQSIDYDTDLTVKTSNDVEHTISLFASGGKPSELSLIAAHTNMAPNIDGNGSDQVWNQAQPLTVELFQVESTAGDNRTFNATLKAAYDGEYIYFLAEVEDAAPHEIPNHLEFHGGDPNDDANWTLETNGQDGIGFAFPATDNVQGKGHNFSEIGCMTSCHTTPTLNDYEGGFYPEMGRIDVWYWKSGTTNPLGKADDYYANGKDGDPSEVRRGDVAGRTFSDPNFRPDGTTLPVSVAGSENNGWDKSKFIWDPDSEPYSPSNVNPATGQNWASGDIVPGWKLREQSNPFSGRGDVEAKGKHINGKWIVEFKRLLNTESNNSDDIIINTNKELPFSFCYFDNTRKYAEFEYLNLNSLPRPGHFGTNPYVILLKFQ